MHGIQPIAKGLGALGVGILVGCQTLEPPTPGVSAVDTTLPALDEDSARFAEVLARYAQGLIHDFNQQYDAALTNYLQAVELDTSNEDLNLRIAMGLLQQRRNDEAVRVMEALVRREPESGKALAWMALIYRAADQPDKAEETYRRLLALDPGDATVYLDFAAFHLRDGRREEAREVLRAGIRKALEPLELHRTLAATLVEEATETEDEAEAKALREGALEQYRRAVRIEPDDAATLVQLGSLNMLNGNVEETLRWYRKVEELAPRDLLLRRRLAVSFQQGMGAEEAIASLAALAADTNPAQVYYYLGELHESNGEIDEAVEALRQACLAARKSPLPVLRLALLQSEHKQMDEATQTLLDGIERIPDHAELTTLLAFTYLNREQPDSALEWFAKAETLRQAESEEAGTAYAQKLDHASFYFSYAKAAVLGGRTDEAIRRLTRVLDDNVAYLLRFMVELLAEEDPETDQTLAFFQAFVEAAPDEPAVHYCLGMVKSMREDHDGALADYKRALTIAQTHHRNTQILDADFYFAYGAAHERTGLIDEAEALFRKTLGLNPDHAATLNYQAYMWAERGENLDEAMTYVLRALELEPDTGAYLDTLGWVHYQQGDNEAALREIERAADLMGDDPVITDHLGDVLFKLDRKEDALEYWKQAFQLDPENEAVADKLRDRGVDIEALRGEKDELADDAEPEPETEADADADAETETDEASGDGEDAAVPGSSEAPADGDPTDEDAAGPDEAGGSTPSGESSRGILAGSPWAA